MQVRSTFWIYAEWQKSHCKTFLNIKKLPENTHTSVRIISFKFLEAFSVIVLYNNFVFHYGIRNSINSNTPALKIS